METIGKKWTQDYINKMMNLVEAGGNEGFVSGGAFTHIKNGKRYIYSISVEEE